MINLRYHPLVQRDVTEILVHYHSISVALEEAFWLEFIQALASISENPGRHHYDQSGYRRCNLKKYPYHILFRINKDTVVVLVVRHNRRHPKFGVKRID